MSDSPTQRWVRDYSSASGKVSRIPLVYVAGPFRASTPWEVEQNTRNAEGVAARVWLAGGAALCPHTNARFFDGLTDDDVFLRGDLEMLRRCDALVMAPGWEHSTGSLGEFSEAQRLGLPVFYSPDLRGLQAWIRDFSETA